MFYLADFKRRYEKELDKLPIEYVLTSDKGLGRGFTESGYIWDANRKVTVGKIREQVKKWRDLTDTPRVRELDKELKKGKLNPDEEYYKSIELRNRKDYRPREIRASTGGESFNYNKYYENRVAGKSKKELEKRKQKRLTEKTERLEKLNYSKKAPINKKFKTQKGSIFRIGGVYKQKDKEAASLINNMMDGFVQTHLGVVRRKDQLAKENFAKTPKPKVNTKKSNRSKGIGTTKGVTSNPINQTPQVSKVSEKVKKLVTNSPTQKTVTSKVGKGLGRKVLTGLGVTALGVGVLGGLNKLRKSRADKGKRRGKYRK